MEQIFARKDLASFSQRSFRPSDTSGASGSPFPESRSTSIAHFSSVIQIFLICNQISSCYFVLIAEDETLLHHIDCQFINMEKSVTCFLLKKRTVYSRTSTFIEDSQGFSYINFLFSVNRLSAEFRYKDYVIFAIPMCVIDRSYLLSL